jgi:predicted DNA-binding protein
MGAQTNAKGDAQPMYVRLPIELHEAVKERSAQDDRTMAQTIRVALRFYLQQTEPLAP